MLSSPLKAMAVSFYFSESASRVEGIAPGENIGFAIYRFGRGLLFWLLQCDTNRLSRRLGRRAIRAPAKLAPNMIGASRLFMTHASCK